MFKFLLVSVPLGGFSRYLICIMKPVRMSSLFLKSRRFKRNAIGFGSDSKNTVAFIGKRGGACLISASHGPLLEAESVKMMEKTVEGLLKKSRPQVAAVDLHPDYCSTVYGESISAKLSIPLMRIQHHHAHAAACMAEHGLNESLALVFDGTGYGIDGNLWGAELLHITPDGFTRLATFAPAPLPGGDASVREPYRQLAARVLFSASPSKGELSRFCQRYGINPEHAAIWLVQAEKNINCPRSHSVGRLFDSVSCLLGLAPRIAKEAEAAINLQKAAESCTAKPASNLMPFKTYEKGGLLFIDWSQIFDIHNINISRLSAARKYLLALSFHHSLADAAMKMVGHGTAKSAERKIVLSGGVFMNSLLISILSDKLCKAGLKVFTHAKVPANDSCISVGQAVIASSIGT